MAPKQPLAQPEEQAGPGRPMLGVKRVQALLTPEDIELARQFGDGNLSLGLRVALQIAKRSAR